MKVKNLLKIVQKKLGFTLIELLILVTIIAILSAIIFIVTDPQSIMKESRDSARSTDVNTIATALNRYLADSSTADSGRNLSDLVGYSQLVNDAITNVGGSCPGGTQGNNLKTVNGAYAISNTTGANTLDVGILIYHGYIPKVLSDPDGTKYYACIDTSNANNLVIYAPDTEKNSLPLRTAVSSDKIVAEMTTVPITTILPSTTTIAPTTTTIIPTTTAVPTTTIVYTSVPVGAQLLRLTAMCSDSPNSHRVWRIRNVNSYAVPFTWVIYGSNQNGSNVVLGLSDLTIQTQTISGDPNTMVISVNGVQNAVKASSPTRCGDR